MSQYAITRGDIFGGLTAGVVALPLCLAFGVASGLGPAAGLYGGIILGIAASLLGGTPVQVSGPTAPMTLISAGVVAANTLQTGEVNLSNVFGVFVLAGALQALFGIARLGRYVRFLPYPVISGLMTGIGIIIIIQQIFPAAGLDSPSSNPVDHSSIAWSRCGMVSIRARCCFGSHGRACFPAASCRFRCSAVPGRSRCAHDHCRRLRDFGSDHWRYTRRPAALHYTRFRSCRSESDNHRGVSACLPRIDRRSHDVARR